MGFKVLVNGQPVYDEEKQVLEVAIQTSQGEKFKFGVGDMGAVDIVLRTVQAGDPVRLDQLDAARADFNRALVDGVPTGTPPPEFNPALLQKQGVSNSTIVSGEGDPTPGTLQLPPSVDLSQNLTLDDSATRTARIKDFNEHGDAAKAVADNPPGSGTDAAQEVEPIRDTTDDEAIKSESTTSDTPPDDIKSAETPGVLEPVGAPSEPTPDFSLTEGSIGTPAPPA